MKFSASVNVDNRNVDLGLSMKKEEGETDFFEDIGKIFNNNAKTNPEIPGVIVDVTDVD